MPDPEEIEQYIERLKLHRRTLSHYLRQRAEFSDAFLPPQITHGIIEARANIKAIKQTLRTWKVDVEDHPDDDELIIEQPESRGTRTKLLKIPQILVVVFMITLLLGLFSIFANRLPSLSTSGIVQQGTSVVATLTAIISPISSETSITKSVTAIDVSSTIQPKILPSTIIPTAIPLPTVIPGSISFSSPNDKSKLSDAFQWRQGGSKDSNYDLNTDSLTLFSGPGTDQWMGRDDTPLISFPIAGDFDVQVKVSFFPSNEHQFAGLGLRSAEDALTWVRITRGNINGQVVGVGETVQGTSSPSTPVNYSSDIIYLRIRRMGALITLFYKEEGKEWSNLKKIEMMLPKEVELCFIAYSTDDFVGATAQFSNLIILPGS